MIYASVRDRFSSIKRKYVLWIGNPSQTVVVTSLEPNRNV